MRRRSSICSCDATGVNESRRADAPPAVKDRPGSRRTPLNARKYMMAYGYAPNGYIWPGPPLEQILRRGVHKVMNPTLPPSEITLTITLTPRAGISVLARASCSCDCTCSCACAFCVPTTVYMFQLQFYHGILYLVTGTVRMLRGAVRDPIGPASGSARAAKNRYFS